MLFFPLPTRVNHTRLISHQAINQLSPSVVFLGGFSSHLYPSLEFPLKALILCRNGNQRLCKHCIHGLNRTDINIGPPPGSVIYLTQNLKHSDITTQLPAVLVLISWHFHQIILTPVSSNFPRTKSFASNSPWVLYHIIPLHHSLHSEFAILHLGAFCLNPYFIKILHIYFRVYVTVCEC